ncbi:MAG: hypothetical protein COV69_00590 [Parcubacteria group bacterium CG11_big_fil_rev_8_21_14_0_20_39_14]|nr:MAG: hypothetical protein COV69_00590 [Parcubacteria group bacterium CG11_big_fil_rev_8_21_14_0_20_39_14]PIS35388.1 MAG: hypothetical protein COT36_02635 [Parcubacteria group bacterium CG08_land_8_20_14_0_20_38_56]
MEARLFISALKADSLVFGLIAAAIILSGFIEFREGISERLRKKLLKAIIRKFNESKKDGVKTS